MEENIQKQLKDLNFYSSLRKHNPIRDSGDTGVWRLEDEDGSGTGILISRYCITIPYNTLAPIMIIWATEENIQKRVREIEEQDYCPDHIVTSGTLHRLKRLNVGNESSLIEQKKVLIYRANTESRRYEPMEDFSKSDMAVNDDEDTFDWDEFDWDIILNESSKDKPEQSGTAAENGKAI